MLNIIAGVIFTIGIGIPLFGILIAIQLGFPQDKDCKRSARTLAVNLIVYVSATLFTGVMTYLFQNIS